MTRGSRTDRRRRALGGVVGPAVFVAGWSVLGAATAGYSPVADPISRLAAIGADTRPAMTAAFLGYAIGVGAFASAVDRTGARPVAVAAAVNAAATLAVAATPLDSAVGGIPHALAAGTGYLSLAAMPLLASPVLRRAGRRAAARASVVTGVVAAGALAASLALDPTTGLWQRVGLTVGDAWIVVAALALHRDLQRHEHTGGTPCQGDSS